MQERLSAEELACAFTRAQAAVKQDIQAKVDEIIGGYRDRPDLQETLRAVSALVGPMLEMHTAVLAAAMSGVIKQVVPGKGPGRRK